MTDSYLPINHGNDMYNSIELYDKFPTMNAEIVCNLLLDFFFILKIQINTMP